MPNFFRNFLSSSKYFFFSFDEINRTTLFSATGRKDSDVCRILIFKLFHGLHTAILAKACRVDGEQNIVGSTYLD